MANFWDRQAKAIVQWAMRSAIAPLLLLITISLTSCAQNHPPVRLLELPDRPTGSEVRNLSGNISEVAPPSILLDLAELATDIQPEVEIAYPKPNQTLDDTALTAKVRLRGLSIYKDEATQLGPHLKVILDNRPAQDVYDLEEPIAFSDLLPGSHTLRVLAVLPWGESFKNTSAYAQTTFHIFAQTAENTPNPDRPLLTYNEPQDTLSEQPVLLDFYLNNAPLHLVAQENTADDIHDWQIRCTVNGQTFLFDRWQPIYLRGLKPGQNWVHLELIDEQGDRIPNAFNSTVRLINYNPEQKDARSKLIRGEFSIEQVGQIVIPDYVPTPPKEEIEDSLIEEKEADVKVEDAEDAEKIENAEEAADSLEEPEIVSSDKPTEFDTTENQDELAQEKETEEAKQLDAEDVRQPADEPIDRDRSNLLDETQLEPALPKAQPIPGYLATPTEETNADFPKEDLLEEPATTELAPAPSEPSASDPKTDPIKEETPAKPKFLEQIRDRWRSFRNNQDSSQNNKASIPTAPITALPQVDVDASEFNQATDLPDSLEAPTPTTDIKESDRTQPSNSQNQTLNEPPIELQPVEIDGSLDPAELEPIESDLLEPTELDSSKPVELEPTATDPIELETPTAEDVLTP